MKNFLLVILTILCGFSFGQTLIWSEGLTTAGAPATFTSSWTFTTGSGSVSSSSPDAHYRVSNSQTNIPMFTTSFTATAGRKYYLTYSDLFTSGTGVNLRIYISNINTTHAVGNMNTTTNYVSGTNALTSNSPANYRSQTTSQWTCPTTGTYWFAFYATTGSGTMRVDDIKCYEIIPPCTAPTVPSVLSTTVHSATDITFSWTPGSGDSSIVFVSPIALSSNVVNGTKYTANKTYTLGTSLGNGYCVYNGSGSSVRVTELDRNTSYTFTVYSYFDNGGAPCYKKDVITSTTSTTLNIAKSWYVNDGSTIGDIWCTAVGSDVGTRGKPSSPYASLESIFASGLLVSGDTIKVDVGTYTSADSKHRDLVLPNLTGLKIIGAGNTKTIFHNYNGSDHNFLYIDKNNTELQDLKLVEFSKETCGGPMTGQALGVASNITGVKITRVIVDDDGTSSNLCGYPIQINSGANVTFSGGGASCNIWDGGAGVKVDNATVTFTDYIFYYNRNAVAGVQPALLVTAGSNVTLNGCRFSENKQNKVGSAITILGGTLNVYDSYFEKNINNNSETGIGGSISIQGGTFGIYRSQFEANGMTNIKGGAIGAQCAGCNVTISQCLFANNVGVVKDIYNDGANMTIDQCTAGIDVFNKSGTMNITNPGTYNTKPDTTSIMITGTCTSAVLLPVEILTFNVNSRDNKNIITWLTSSERNNDYFILEHSGEDVKFNLLGEIPGNGTTSTISYYKVEDICNEGVNYYRLSQVDYNGNVKVIKTIFIYNECGNMKVSYCDGILTFYNLNVNNEITITDLNGKIINHYNIDYDNVKTYKTEIQLNTGFYFIKINGDVVKIVI